MTNISKTNLKPEAEQKLLKQFSNLFADISSHKAQSLFEQILTKSERIMLIKRLAIVLMLEEGFSTYKISKTLKVSDATVRSIRHYHRKKEFNFVLGVVKKTKFDYKKFLDVLDILLRAGMPPRGRGRWQFLKKSLRK